MIAQDAAGNLAALIDGGIEKYRAGDLREAAEWWRRAVDLDPHDERARANLEWAESQLPVEMEMGVETLSGVAPPSPESENGAGFPLDLPPEIEQQDRRGVTPTWVPAVSRRGQPNLGGAEGQVRQFMTRTPTRPNLPPLDVPVLNEAQVVELAGNAVPRPGPPGRSPLDESMAVARRSLDEGNVEAALRFVERAVTEAGGIDSPSLATHHTLMQSVYDRSLGDRARTVKPGAESQSLDARSAYLLSRVDGTFSIDDLLDISGMDRLEATRTVLHLIRKGSLLA